jgi:glutamyl-tRNA reductase
MGFRAIDLFRTGLNNGFDNSMTIRPLPLLKFEIQKNDTVKHFRAIAITHKKAKLEDIGQFHIEDSQQESRLQSLKANCGLEELMYLSTCNRVEFYFVSTGNVHEEDFLIEFFHAFNPGWSETQLQKAIMIAEYYKGDEAIRHVFNVASSLDSMVIGEREIITQVRSSYEKSQKMGLTGDTIRLVMKKTVEAAKEVYTHTEIAAKPVSVVSLAYRKLRDMNVSDDARILFVGAGQTNTTMAKFLVKHGFKNFLVFNRSVGNGLALANELKCELKELKDLGKYKGGFDVIITCTASSEPIITPEVYDSLLNGDTHAKIVVDLAIPNDFDTRILAVHKVKVINVENLKEEAELNLREREKELTRCNAIIDRLMDEFKEVYRARQVERAMAEVPTKMKEIKDVALSSIFAKEIASMDANSREVMDKVIAYLEKKYISVPMKMAKEILLEGPKSNVVVEKEHSDSMH